MFFLCPARDQKVIQVCTHTWNSLENFVSHSLKDGWRRTDTKRKSVVLEQSLGVLIVTYFLDISCSSTCVLQVKFCESLPPARLTYRSSIRGNRYMSTHDARFNVNLKSPQIRTLSPLPLSTGTIGPAQSANLTGSVIPSPWSLVSF